MPTVDIPPTIVRKYKVLPSTLKKIDLLGKYDFSSVTNAFNDDLIRAGRPFSCEQVYPIIVRFGKADFEIARRLELEFCRFVALTLLTPKNAHAPAGAIDMYWHFFILHSEEYTDFCKKIWGNFEGDPKYRHHYPATDETRPGMLDAYIETRRLYVEVFGEPELFTRPGARPVEVWTRQEKHPTSGDSYSGIVKPQSRHSAKAPSVSVA